LRRALRDVLAQEYQAWNLHIVNDGGDASIVDGDMAAYAGELADRVLVTHNAKPHGRSAAANQGVAALDTEFIVLHDDDDLWDPAFLARTVDWLDRNRDDIGVVARTQIIYETATDAGFVETGRAPFWQGMTRISYSELLQSNRAVPISYLYRRRLHDEVGMYREDLHAVEDWEFNLRTAVRHRIGFLDGDPLAFWMQRSRVEGELGNSMFALASEHELYDRIVRDEALREYAAHYGPGLALYLTRFIGDEMARQLDDRRTLGQRVAGHVRDLWRGWRSR
jgi:glycosyltransferase involved in cell wall biosynthesis